MVWTNKSRGWSWRIQVSILLLVVVLGIAIKVPPAQAESGRSIKVMNQNMDSGTDLKLVFFFLPDITLGATLTYAEILQNDIPGRATVLASEIAAKKPDIISLQEVTLWRTGALGSEAKNVLFDQLQLLMGALAERKESYYVVETQELSDITAPLDPTLLGLPFDPQLTEIRFTDRDVVLARSDTHITVSNAQKGKYQATIDLTQLGFPVQAPRGWISADVTVEDTTLRFFGTHLESTYAGTGLFDVYARGIQVAQATELIGLMDSANMPVILAGDFNSNPVPNGFENTATTGLLLTAGFTEIWNALHPFETGFTWPLYLEDPQEPNPAGPFERIDLIYQRDLEMLNIERIIRHSSPFASDHAGVVAILRVGK